MFWIVWLRSATGNPVAFTLATGKAMPSTTTSGASFCAILRDVGLRTSFMVGSVWFIFNLLFIPLDAASGRQHRLPVQAPGGSADDSGFTGRPSHGPPALSRPWPCRILFASHQRFPATAPAPGRRCSFPVLPPLLPALHA